jgi:hypothetical protein
MNKFPYIRGLWISTCLLGLILLFCNSSLAADKGDEVSVSEQFEVDIIEVKENLDNVILGCELAATSSTNELQRKLLEVTTNDEKLRELAATTYKRVLRTCLLKAAERLQRQAHSIQ